MNMKISDRLKYARLKSGLTQEALAKRAGVSQQAIYMIESGLSERPRKLENIAKILGVTPEWLQFGIIQKITHNLNRTEIPLLERNQIYDWLNNKPVPITRRITMSVFVTNLSPKAFAMEVEDEMMVSSSMPRKSLYPGDVVVVDRDYEAKVGNLVLADINGNFQILELIEYGGNSMLRPFNTQYQPITIDKNVKILGVMRFKHVEYT